MFIEDVGELTLGYLKEALLKNWYLSEDLKDEYELTEIRAEGIVFF